MIIVIIIIIIINVSVCDVDRMTLRCSSKPLKTAICRFSHESRAKNVARGVRKLITLSIS